MEQQNKIALVTGASRGLGYATAVALAKQGYHIVALARTVGGLEELADQVEPISGITLVPLDITDEGGLQRLCLSIYERWGHLDVLVHCAVKAPLLTPVNQITDKDYDGVLAVNARATARIIALCEPLLKVAPDGVAIFMDDPHQGERFFGAYGASKAAAKSLVQSWQAETERLKPRVILHTPNPMPTATRARFHPGEDKSGLATAADEADRLIAQHLS